MRRIPVILLLGGVFSVLGGCNRGSDSASGENRTTETSQGSQLAGVAVVDLDEVARRVGSDVAMVQAIRDGEATLNQQLQSMQTSLQEQYRQKKRELENAMAAGQQDQAAGTKQLETIGQQLDLQLNQAWREANNQLNAHRQRLILNFREEVKPVAQEVAAQRGLGVVVTKNENVLLTFDDSRDITDAVVERVLARRAAARSGSTASVASRPAPPDTTRR